MKKKNNFFLWLLLFIFLTTYSLDSIKITKSSFFPVKIIKIEGVINANKEEIEKRFSQFNGKSIIFISRSQFKEISRGLKFIKELQVKKIYPDKIKLNVIEYKPMGVFVDKNKKLLLLEGGGIIENYENNKFNHLPLVIGNGAQKKFHLFYQSLENVNFESSLVKQFNYFDINRWDVILKDGKVVKLPTESYENSFKKFLSIYKKSNFSNFKVFDFRIKGQLVLK